MSGCRPSEHEPKPCALLFGAVTDVVHDVICVQDLDELRRPWHVKLHDLQKRDDPLSAPMGGFARKDLGGCRTPLFKCRRKHEADPTTRRRPNGAMATVSM